MKFTYSISVQKTTPEAWDKMKDPLGMIHCLPGLEKVDTGEDNQYDVVLSTRLGPVKLKFNGNAKVSSPGERQMEANVRMTDRISGSVHGSFHMALEPAADPEWTDVAVTADVNIAGKLGEFAQPLIKKKADQIMKEFSDNLKAYIA